MSLPAAPDSRRKHVEKAEYRSQHGPVRCVTLNGDGQALAAGFEDRTAQLGSPPGAGPVGP